MNNAVMITELGMKSVMDSATPSGFYVDVKYYVPVYDWKIDPAINSTLTGIGVSSCTSPSDIVPSGEVVWNNPSTDGYDESVVASDGMFLHSYKTLTSPAVNKALQNSTQSVNIAKIGSGARLVFPSYLGNGERVDVYRATNGECGGNFNPVDGFDWKGTWTKLTSAEYYDKIPPDPLKVSYRDLFSGVTYTPVHDVNSEGIPQTRGKFRVAVHPRRGTIKFNKIAVYATHAHGNGITDSAPFLFAQIIFPSVQVVNSSAEAGNGISAFDFDFELQFKTEVGSFDKIFFSSYDDYWSRCTVRADGTYGLAYDGDIYVGESVSYDDIRADLTDVKSSAVTKMFVSTSEWGKKKNVNRETNMPQFGLQYVVGGNNGTIRRRIRTTFRVTGEGDCEIDFYGACDTNNKIFAFIPYTEFMDKIPKPAKFGFGNNEHRWDSFFGHRLLDFGIGLFSMKYLTALDKDGGGLRVRNSSVFCDCDTTKVGDVFFRGNVKATDDSKLFVRGSLDKNGKDTDVVIGNGNCTYRSWKNDWDWGNNKSTYQMGGLSNSDMIKNLRLAYQHLFKKVDRPCTVLGDIGKDNGDIDTLSGNTFITANGLIHLMASPVIYENMFPIVDSVVDAGGFNSRFRTVGLRVLTGGPDSITVQSSLVPDLDIKASLTLGTKSAPWNTGWFDYLYAKTQIEVGNNLVLNNSAINFKNNGGNITGLVRITFDSKPETPFVGLQNAIITIKQLDVDTINCTNLAYKHLKPA